MCWFVESFSSTDESFDPRVSSSQLSQRSSRSNNRTQDQSSRHTRRSNRDSSVPEQQQQPSTSKSKPKPTGASKRKPNKPTSRSNVGALQQIRYLQLTTMNCIPKAPFCRVVKEVLHNNGDYRMSKSAIDALQDALEAYAVRLFSDSLLLTLHRKRITISPGDIQLCLYIRGDDPGVK